MLTYAPGRACIRRRGICPVSVRRVELQGAYVEGIRGINSYSFVPDCITGLKKRIYIIRIPCACYVGYAYVQGASSVMSVIFRLACPLRRQSMLSAFPGQPVVFLSLPSTKSLLVPRLIRQVAHGLEERRIFELRWQIVVSHRVSNHPYQQPAYTRTVNALTRTRGCSNNPVRSSFPS